MRLLFDQNLSPSLVRRLSNIYPDAQHVSMVGLGSASDEMVWRYARTHAYAIVTKDADFADMGAIHGFPPQIVWIQLGNCTTHHIELVLRAHCDAIVAMDDDTTAGVLTIVEIGGQGT